jgi:hypothetical protein
MHGHANCAGDSSKHCTDVLNMGSRTASPLKLRPCIISARLTGSSQRSAALRCALRTELVTFKWHVQQGASDDVHCRLANFCKGGRLSCLVSGALARARARPTHLERLAKLARKRIRSVLHVFAAAVMAAEAATQ